MAKRRPPVTVEQVNTTCRQPRHSRHSRHGRPGRILRRVAATVSLVAATVAVTAAVTATVVHQMTPPTWAFGNADAAHAADAADLLAVPYRELLPLRTVTDQATRTVTVVLVEPADGNRRGLTPAIAAELVRRTDRIWSNLTHGTIRIRLDRVVDWVTVDTDQRCTLTMARSAADLIGWTGDGDAAHLVTIEPDDTCPSVGTGQIGGPLIRLAWGWSDGDLDRVADAYAHELGHNVGLGHTSTATCSAALRRPCPGNLETPEHRDVYGGDDVMGGAGGPLRRTLNPIARWQLGLLTADALATVDTAAAGQTTVVLRPPGAGAGVEALRLVDPARKVTWWLSFDTTLPAAPVVRVHTSVGDPAGTERFTVLQQRATPDDPYLRPGTVYRFDGGQLTVTVERDRAAVTVTTGAPTR